MQQIQFVFKNKNSGEEWKSPLVVIDALKSTYFEAAMKWNNNNVVEFVFENEQDLGYHPLQAIRVLEDLNQTYMEKYVPIPFSLIGFFHLSMDNLKSVRKDVLHAVLKRKILRYKMSKLKSVSIVSDNAITYNIPRPGSRISMVSSALIRCVWDTEEEELPHLVFQEQILIRHWNGTLDHAFPSVLLDGCALRFRMSEKRYIAFYFATYAEAYYGILRNVWMRNYFSIYYPFNHQLHSVLVIPGLYKMFESDNCYCDNSRNCICKKIEKEHKDCTYNYENIKRLVKLHPNI